jgi:hypothetical protein
MTKTAGSGSRSGSRSGSISQRHGSATPCDAKLFLHNNINPDLDYSNSVGLLLFACYVCISLERGRGRLNS